MPDAPPFRKADRYKASSYQAYNVTLPDRYDSCFWMRFCQVRRWDDAVRAELGPDIASMRILDVGCATGRLLASLGEAGAEELFGVDLAPRIIEVAREKLARRGLRAELRTGDAEDVLPWDPASFDVVTVTGALHHFSRPREALGEMHRVLSPGGRLVVVDPAFFPPIRHLVNLGLRVAPHWGDFRFYSRRKAARLLESVGFQVHRSRRLDLWSYLVAAEKVARRP